MTEFTASNGVVIDVSGNGRRVKVNCSGITAALHDMSSSETTALREFFQDERDRELGRWRWPENRDYVVYPRTGDGYIGDEIRVVFEIDGSKVDISRAHVDRVRENWDDQVSNPHWHAARAFFDAHPEPKPWHDAKPGEVWILTHVDRSFDPIAATWNGRGFVHIDVIPSEIPFGEIKHARRIWPEATS